MEHFKTLRVPLETQSRLKNVKKLQAEEEKNIAVLEESMIKLQEAIDKSVEEAELRREKTARLENEIQAYKRELEEMLNELSCKESNDVLSLPKLQKESLEAPVLQELLLKIPNQEGVLRDLNQIQQSEEMMAMLDSLEQAYENVDEYEVEKQEEDLDTEQSHDDCSDSEEAS